MSSSFTHPAKTFSSFPGQGERHARRQPCSATYVISWDMPLRHTWTREIMFVRSISLVPCWVRPSPLPQLAAGGIARGTVAAGRRGAERASVSIVFKSCSISDFVSVRTKGSPLPLRTRAVGALRAEQCTGAAQRQVAHETVARRFKKASGSWMR